MGVSERTIRIENNNIILDFPGSQSLSAAELIKASAMYFHIVNEKFSLMNPELHDNVNQFLQNVWNEAVVTNRKDVQSINQIAWEHLGAGEQSAPRTEVAKALYDAGLRLAGPKDTFKSSAFNDTLSSVAVLRGQEPSEWQGQTNPLVIVFHNFALEGSNLTNIYVGYDPSRGNMLSFAVKNSYDRSGKGNPQDDFHAWTSQFSEDNIAGTVKEAYSQGKGWRMAVILNDTIVTSPFLEGALRDGGTITGHFTQREITQLAADLKAGSLSFTPQILSEQNVSAELGNDERTKGLGASLMGMVLVACVMIGYYRFAGLVATCVVVFNLLIMWGVLQNLGAALTLPGIAGIVLTIGMAVDANVLVYERIREEFRVSGRIASAIQAGYRKAFSAIFDSNITTIIAALILIQFDSGPIKGFAVTLIIGLVSSMFTALFMTRYFYAGWVQNPSHKELKMAELIGQTKFDFLGKAKFAVTVSLIFMLLGGFFFYKQSNSMLGMDFKGGYSLTVDLKDKGPDYPYRNTADEALLAHGAYDNDFSIRQLSQPNQLRIQLSLGMEEEGHPYYQMPKIVDGLQYTYPYEQNPRIKWLVDALADKGLQIKETQLKTLDLDWSTMSGQFSDTMRHNAFWALSLALVCILIYISIRFEFKYAVGGVIALLHDVIITIGIYSMLSWLGASLEINLTVIGAIMTILGYSLNNTIVIFDRIREDMKLYRKDSFYNIINHSVNVTLGRSILTSTTTLVAVMPFVLFGGSSIFDFSLIMAIGIVMGVFSSLFIAGPIMYFFHIREQNEANHARV
jgi:SecD/SecF fusion protein